jgi:drug/metabolite transporter (DMT)-like permease
MNNPNETTAESTSVAESDLRARRRAGPSLYIVTGGLVGVIFGVPLLASKDSTGVLLLFAGCILGGLSYRATSRSWDHDPSVRRRQLIYSGLAVTLLPVLLSSIAGDHFLRIPYAIIGLVVGVAIACGIFASGTRRFGRRRLAEQTDGLES